ncbi:MAG: M15 family metallopeptidase [Treponema sp.]|nr:M15 family metallopeptidase [Treponema sp.]
MSFFRGVFLKRPIILSGVILAVGLLFAIGIVNPAPEPKGYQAELAVAVLPPEEIEPTKAQRVAQALVEAYPDITQAEFRNGDWAVLLRGTWFYYAEGRMLPGELMDKFDEYRPLAFYDNYPHTLPAWTLPTPEQVSRFQAAGTARSAQVSRAHHFFDALYQASGVNESSRRVSPVKFLGRQITVHRAIQQALASVEARILQAAQTDPQVQTWIDEIESVHGWNWRNVAGTQSRSFHSYGVAIDIVPRNLGGRAVYWLWAGPTWWNTPHERRHHPPEAVVQAFQAYGFVWGGKWAFFDTIHFEFRPEVMILTGIELSAPAY